MSGMKQGGFSAIILLTSMAMLAGYLGQDFSAYIAAAMVINVCGRTAP